MAEEKEIGLSELRKSLGNGDLMQIATCGSSGGGGGV